ncbi:MAG: hypothetical protein P8K73_00485 [Methylophilaceae bacterium]|nr:hypothetical protein [Methylophilaceae bacterium]
MKLNVYYDMNYAPASFNFASYLVLANAVRQKMGVESMGITIVADQYRKRTAREENRPESEMKFKVAHILSKLPFLIPEVESLDITTTPLTEIKRPTFPFRYPGREDDLNQIPYSDGFLHEFYGQEDINLRPYRASEQAKFFVDNLFGDDVITIQLRTSYNLSVRNSNLDEWYKVYQELKRLRFRPIVIPDFEDCLTNKLFTKYDWEVFEPAAFDHDIRLALSEKAINNLVVNHGANAPMIHSDCPYILFKWIAATVEATVECHKKSFLIDYGEDLKWAGPNQHLIWDDDNADIILKALNL